MSRAQKIFDYYIKASVHVALAVVSLSLVTGLLLNIPIPNELILFILFGSITSYNFIKYGPTLKRFRPSISGYRTYTALFGLIAGVLTLYLGLMLPSKTWPVLLFLLIVILLYTYPIAHRDRNLRSLGVIKVILVAISWTTVTVYLPAAGDGSVGGWDLNIFAIQSFLLVLSLIIPFEIRDMRFDPPDIRTIPRRIGVVGTKQLGILAMILSTLLTFLRDDISYLEIVVRGFLLILVSLLIWKTPTDSSKYYASFWVEAVPIFWLGLILGLKAFF